VYDRQLHINLVPSKIQIFTEYGKRDKNTRLTHELDLDPVPDSSSRASLFLLYSVVSAFMKQNKSILISEAVVRTIKIILGSFSILINGTSLRPVGEAKNVGVTHDSFRSPISAPNNSKFLMVPSSECTKYPVTSHLLHAATTTSPRIVSHAGPSAAAAALHNQIYIKSKASLFYPLLRPQP
jgi:hypothetical protein